MKRLVLVVTAALVLALGIVGCALDKTPTSYSPPPLKPAEITVVALTVNPPIAMGDEVITITATLVNTGDVQGTYLATLKLNGEKQYETSVTVPGNSTKYVSFQSKGGLGDYNASVGELSASFTVVAPAPTQTTPTPSQNPLSDYYYQLYTQYTQEAKWNLEEAKGFENLAKEAFDEARKYWADKATSDNFMRMSDRYMDKSIQYWDKAKQATDQARKYYGMYLESILRP